MISLYDLLDHARLARAVLRLSSQVDALTQLAAEAEDRAQVAEAAYEALLASTSAPDPPRDAASPEAEVLRLAYRADRSWRDDVEGPALRQQLQAAEVELAAARAEVATVRARLMIEQTSTTEIVGRFIRRETEALDRAAILQRRLDRRGLTVARLVTALRRIRRVHAPDVLRIMVADLPIDAGPADSTQDQPPPTQPSERRPVEPAPERAVRVAVSS